MTRHPAASARGACSRDTAAPAENSAKSQSREVKALQFLDRVVAPAKADPATDGALARERMQLPDREIAFLEHVHHRLPDEAGGADDGYRELPVHALNLLQGVGRCGRPRCHCAPGKSWGLRLTRAISRAVP